MEKLPLSVVVITKDEENSIERCLRSAPFASELLVVDSFSKDATAETAQRAGARVLREAWRGFGAQKKFAVDQARHDWILSLDADEAVSPELAEEIRRRFSSLDEQTGYLIPRRSYHLGRWILHGGWFPDRQLRLFHRGHSNWGGERIHEQVHSPRRAFFTSPILHWVFEDLSDQVITNDRYAGLQAQELLRRGVKFSVWRLVTKPPVKFFENYVWKRGFLDGLPGFLIAVSSSYSVFLKHAKLWELERRARVETP
ncbi:MAG: glycosyltransferase family 2 protein [Bdellovibrionaceae bacterium]|nr:glycosyltransferase family 2 protein [Pseudobdellovibrionaceae bacterium]